MLLPTAKFFLDGVIEHPTQTAAMLEPYLVEEDGRWVPGPSSGPTYFPQRVLNRAVAALDAAGWQVHMHVIGDRATRSALDAFEHARDRNGASGLRHTLAHLEVVDPADIPRLGALDVLANLQLQWAQRDPYTVEHLAPYLGRARWEDLYPARRAPRRRRDAVRRQRLARRRPAPVRADRVLRDADRGAAGTARRSRCFPEQAITLREALEMHTAASAYQLHQEAVTGRIEPGLEADLIVLDRDLLAVPIGEVAQTGVDLTMIAGRVVHRA